MGDEFLIELVAEHDDVLKLRREGSLIRMIPAVPDLRFPHEIEAATLDHRCPTREPVGAKEDCRAEDPFAPDFVSFRLAIRYWARESTR
jgi:hypothetical protein